jgi:hypothetical protein
MPSRLSDVGTVFQLYIQRRTGSKTVEILDLSQSGTTVEFLFQRPDGTVTTVDATIADPATEGLAEYIVPDDEFFDQTGMWRWEAKVTTPDGSWHTDIRQFSVDDHL